MNQNLTQAIAVIGMSGSFPKSSDLGEFWKNLKNGENCITYYSSDELLKAGIDPDLIHHPHYVKAKGALSDIDLFDADFFDIGPKAAALMDPQHRLFLECAWSALEHAGYQADTYCGLIGIYGGESMSSYAYLNVLPTMGPALSARSLQAAIGNDKDSLTTTASYHLNLRGPAITVQTSSSTSLVAVSLACQQLLSYQCDMALAGGVSAGPPLKSGYFHEEGGITSSDGKCRTFDSKSDGFVPGSGVGLVVLKRLSDAIKDRDTIWAVIKGFAINNDGNKKVSYSSPSLQAQSDVVMMAQEFAEIESESISYIEAHGTATKLGDPVEIAALTKAFRTKTQKNHFCFIGSVKSNIGHLDAAAGIAGLIKTVLCLKHKTLVPSIHFKTPNPELKLENSPFVVSMKTQEWKSSAGPLRAAVTSLGMGGTNTHVVLEEAPEPDRKPFIHLKTPFLLLLSAKTQTALLKHLHRIYSFVETFPESDLDHLVYTLNSGRKSFKYKTVIIFETKYELLEKIDLLIKRFPDSIAASSHPKVAFMFTNFDSPDAKFMQNLFKHQIMFKHAINNCLARLPSIVQSKILAFLDASEPISSGFASSLSSHELRLVGFLSAYGLSSMLNAWGIRPEFAAGCGYGEIAAAAIGNSISIDAALDILQNDVSQKPLASYSASIPIYSCTHNRWMANDEAASLPYWQSVKKQADCEGQLTHLILPDQSSLFCIISPASFSCKMHTDDVSLTLTHSGESNHLKGFLQEIGKLIEKGVLFDWEQYYAGAAYRKIPAPTYPFERKRYWLEPSGTCLSEIQNTAKEMQKQSMPRPNLPTPYIAPISKKEMTLAHIWEEALGLAPVGIQDNFFDLGGTSLEATALLFSINNHFRKSILLRDFYSNATIKELALLIEDADSFDFAALLDDVGG